MESNKHIVGKVLIQALELSEKGVSLHTIVRTYPAYAHEIEDMFGSMALVAKKHAPIDVPESGLERLLQALPEEQHKSTGSSSVASPLNSFQNTFHVTHWKFLVPIAALVILIGGLIISEYISPELVQKKVTEARASSLATGPSNAALQN